MKKTLITLTVLLCAAYGFAQPTIMAYTNNPLPGDKFFLHDCDTNGVTVGPSGAAVTWDLSTLVTAFTDSISFVACSASPYCDSFPEATLAITFDGSYYDYLVTDTGKFALLGSYDGTDMERFTNPYNISMYPMAYGSVLVDTSAQHYDTSLYVVSVDSFIADGYGTLKLPSGTYTNVLRVHVIDYEKDSVPDPTTPIVTYYRSEMYNWYLPGFHFMLLSMEYDTVSGSTPYLADIWYCKYTLPTPPPTFAENIAIRQGIMLYPNPAKEVITIQLSAQRPEDARITLTDMAGKEVLTPLTAKMVPGSNTISCNTSSLAPGLYVVHVTTSSGNFVEKILIER